MYQYGRALGYEYRGKGVHVALGPVLVRSDSSPWVPATGRAFVQTPISPMQA